MKVVIGDEPGEALAAVLAAASLFPQYPSVHRPKVSETDETIWLR
jgi:hypothetical protein